MNRGRERRFSSTSDAGGTLEAGDRPAAALGYS